MHEYSAVTMSSAGRKLGGAGQFFQFGRFFVFNESAFFLLRLHELSGILEHFRGRRDHDGQACVGRAGARTSVPKAERFEGHPGGVENAGDFDLVALGIDAFLQHVETRARKKFRLLDNASADVLVVFAEPALAVVLKYVTVADDTDMVVAQANLGCALEHCAAGV